MKDQNKSEVLVRSLIIATITDTAFLRGLRYLWDPALVGTGWRWVGETCLKWLEEKGEAPGRNIELLWAGRPEDDSGELEGLLEGLSEEFEREDKLDTNALLEQAQFYFNQERLVQNSLLAGEAASAGELERSWELLEKARPAGLPTVTAIDPAKDPEALGEIFSQRSAPLVQLGGALQEMLGELVVRDSFIALLGNEKVGKSWVLQLLEFGALRAGSKVLSFQCGDLSRGQKLGRMTIQITGRNIKPKYCRPTLYPAADCKHNQSNKCSKAERPCGEGVVAGKEEGDRYPRLQPYAEAKEWYTPCWHEGCYERQFAPWWGGVAEECDPLREEEIGEIWQRWGRLHPDLYRIQVYLNNTATVADMDRVMAYLWEYHGWRADLVTDDYPDIHAPEPGTSSKDYRHQENAKWMAMRRMSQAEKWNCSWVCVTQPKEDKTKRERWLLRHNMFSEDKRKRAHVTDALGINCTAEDKRRKLWRINYLFGRDDSFDPEDQVAVLHCLERGQPNLGSYWVRKGER